MKDVIFDTLVDGLKILPFLFLAFFIIEYVEHKVKNPSKIVAKSGKFSVLVGSLLGLLPQCGFGVVATNFYITRIISLGTLMAIYLSTSDEMLVMMVSKKMNIKLIVLVLLIKFIMALLFGYLVDLIFKKRKTEVQIEEVCHDDHCHCERGLVKSSIIHSLKIFFFLIVTTFIINLVLYYFGNDMLAKVFMKNSFLGSFITGLIGLIPNCGASIILVELFLSEAISFGAFISGLLTCAGISILILFKGNKYLKENLFVLGLLYVLGVLGGLIVSVVSIFF